MYMWLSVGCQVVLIQLTTQARRAQRKLSVPAWFILLFVPYGACMVNMHSRLLQATLERYT